MVQLPGFDAPRPAAPPPNRAARRQEARRIAPQAGMQEQFLSSPADIVVGGGAAGAGKTWVLLLEPCRHLPTRGFGGVIFRRTSPQITNEGGLWDESTKLFPLLGGVPRTTDHSWEFPHYGSSVRFAHLQHEKNVHDWQGAQLEFIGFDELTHFTRHQFFYLLSRLRSVTGVRPYVRCTCNPDPDSWVAEFIAWWIDQEEWLEDGVTRNPDWGLPIAERAGKLRWFVRVSDEVVWFDTPEEIAEFFPGRRVRWAEPGPRWRVEVRGEGGEVLETGDYRTSGELDAEHPDPLGEDMRPLSVTFIPGKLSDNPALLAADPGYRAKLQALPAVERARLEGGNWKVRASAGNVFPRDRWRFYDPSELRWRRRCRWVRYWDKAATRAPKEGEPKKDPDWTSGCLMGRDFDTGEFLVRDVVRGRWSSSQREAVMKQTADADGPDVEVWIEQEPGSSGVDSAVATVSNLAGHSVWVHRPTGDKLTRADPYSAQQQVQNVLLPSGAPWVQGWMSEHEAFPTPGVHDDQVDSGSGAFNRLAQAAPPPVPGAWATVKR